MIVNILGTEYEVDTCDKNHDEIGKHDGVCYQYDKRIVIRHPKYLFADDDTEKVKKIRFKEVVTHELIHAFCKESGTCYDDDEALVDWFSFMIPKIVAATDEILRQFGERNASDQG